MNEVQQAEPAKQPDRLQTGCKRTANRTQTDCKSCAETEPTCILTTYNMHIACKFRGYLVVAVPYRSPSLTNVGKRYD